MLCFPKQAEIVPKLKKKKPKKMKILSRESKQFITVKGMPKVQVLNSLGLIWHEIKNTQDITEVTK